MNIVEKWALLEENNYSSILPESLTTNTKDQRNLLTDVFIESTAKLDELDVKMKTRVLLAAATNASEHFMREYNNLSACNNLSLRDQLVDACSQFMDKLAPKIGEKYEGNLGKLIDKKSRSSGNKAEILERVVRKAMDNIENSSKNKGFIYTVTNAERITSYLIGTIHTANLAMSQNQQMIDAVTNSTELITEIGNSALELKFSTDHPSHKIRFSVDLPLTELGIKNNITITALESINDQLTCFSNTVSKASITPITLYRTQQINTHAPYMKHETIESWQEGNEEKMKHLLEKISHPVAQEMFVDGRTNNWSPSLINKLTMTKTPISIAVGAGHCVGNNGLVQQFRNAGLEVKQMET